PLISLAGMVYSRSVRVGGNAMDEAIAIYVKHRHNLLIGEITAETAKNALGSAWTLDKPLSIEITGRAIVEVYPRTARITDAEVREALADSITTIVSSIHLALEVTPPELSADLCDRGIVLTG